jgi:hypothetical protein
VPPTLYLQSDVYAVSLGDDVVVLNVTADTYVCVPGGAALLGLGADGRTFAPADRAVTEQLLAAGLVSEEETLPGLARQPPPRPRQGIADSTGPALTMRDAINLVGALWDLLLHYHRRPFGTILAYSAWGRVVARPRPAGSDLGDLVQRFHEGAIWLPAPGKCLVRSFLLLRFLHRSGNDAQWVFGATTWPFEAHCWLQSGDLVLDDAPEELLRYQPICAL